MSLTQRDVIRPDQVMSPGDVPDQDPAWTMLDPCPSCGARPHDSPEGFDQFTGDPTWVHPHCWRCGFRASADPTEDMRKQAMFNAFQQWYQQETAKDMAHPSLNAPSEDEARAMQERIQQLEQQLAARVSPNVAPTSSQPMTPTVRPEPSQGGESATAPVPATDVRAEPIVPSQTPQDTVNGIFGSGPNPGEQQEGSG